MDPFLRICMIQVGRIFRSENPKFRLDLEKSHPKYIYMCASQSTLLIIPGGSHVLPSVKATMSK